MMKKYKQLLNKYQERNLLLKELGLPEFSNENIENFILEELTDEMVKKLRENLG